MKIEYINESNNLLDKIKNNNEVILKLIKYLEDNGLLFEFYSNLYYKVYKSEPIYEINYYKHKETGNLISLYEVKNSFKELKSLLEEHKVYAYDYIKTLMFVGKEIDVETIRREEYYRSYYENKEERVYPITKDIDLVKLFKNNPLLFVQCIAYFNINIEELINVETKGYVYKKEIKKN